MWTYYRSLAEIRSAYEKYFVERRHIEDYWAGSGSVRDMPTLSSTYYPQEHSG